jgi:hypothetical protein
VGGVGHSWAVAGRANASRAGMYVSQFQIRKIGEE